MMLDTQDTLRLNMASVYEFMSSASSWILGNSASSALSSMVRLLHKLLTLQGLSAEFKLGGVFALEMQAKENLQEEDEEEGKEDQTHNKESLLTPGLASAVLSLLLSILGKEDPGKYKSFIGVLVELSSFFMQADRSYQRSYRKHKALKSLLLYMKVLLEKDDLAENAGMLTQLLHFYTAATYGSPKN